MVSDEVYREFIYNNEKHYSILQQEKLDQHAIMVDSLSKRYSMCGARIGCMVSKNKEVIQTAMKFAQARLSPPSLAQWASEAVLEISDSYYSDLVKTYGKRRNTLVNALTEIPDIKVSSPNAAFYCIIELPVEDAEHFCIWLLSEFHVNNKTVMLSPAKGFYSTPNLGKNQVRLAYILKEEDLKLSVNIIKEGLAVYTKQYATVS